MTEAEREREECEWVIELNRVRERERRRCDGPSLFFFGFDQFNPSKISLLRTTSLNEVREEEQKYEDSLT